MPTRLDGRTATESPQTGTSKPTMSTEGQNQVGLAWRHDHSAGIVAAGRAQPSWEQSAEKSQYRLQMAAARPDEAPPRCSSTTVGSKARIQSPVSSNPKTGGFCHGSV